MSEYPPVTLVCCDLIGTMISDGAIVERSFTEAIATQGIVPGTAAYTRSMVQIERARGCPPADIMHRVFSDDVTRAQAAYIAFERSYQAAIDRYGVTAVPGADEVLARLSGSRVRVCLMSSLSRAALSLVVDTIGLRWRSDLLLSLDDVARGCPSPDLVLTAVLRLGIDDVREVAVVGDTESVILCGRRAGVRIAAGLRTGSRNPARLRQAGATHLVDTIADLPSLLNPAPDGPARKRPGAAGSLDPGEPGMSAA